MCVDLSRGDRCMSQHLLYGAQVCATLYQVRGKGVAESVRADGLLQPDSRRTGLDDIEYHYT